MDQAGHGDPWSGVYVNLTGSLSNNFMANTISSINLVFPYKKNTLYKRTNFMWLIISVQLDVIFEVSIT